MRRMDWYSGHGLELTLILLSALAAGGIGGALATSAMLAGPAGLAVVILITGLFAALQGTPPSGAILALGPLALIAALGWSFWGGPGRLRMLAEAPVAARLYDVDSRLERGLGVAIAAFLALTGGVALGTLGAPPYADLASALLTLAFALPGLVAGLCARRPPGGVVAGAVLGGLAMAALLYGGAAFGQTAGWSAAFGVTVAGALALGYVR